VGGPLEGVFVIDWSVGSAAAIVTMVLADYGAEVVRIDPPGGVPRHQQPSYQAWDRGKKSVVLSLDSAEGREALDQLLSKADVFVADDPDAVAKLWPTDPADRFEQLVYLCLSSDGRVADPHALDDTLTGARLGTFP
jgi:crotonobetainyl-CoA:carnitine CoA-transferase CaiB-like acyl-CoA transferase